MQENCTWGLKYAVVETLKSDTYKKYAKDMILFSLKSTGIPASTAAPDAAASTKSSAIINHTAAVSSSSSPAVLATKKE